MCRIANSKNLLGYFFLISSEGSYMSPRPIPLKIKPFSFASSGFTRPVQSISMEFFIVLENFLRSKFWNSLWPVIRITASDSDNVSEIDFSVVRPNTLDVKYGSKILILAFFSVKILIISLEGAIWTSCTLGL